jgi:choline dehydrogenase-like flavoprotein
MMPRNLGGVVKIYGVNGLSVVDASIMPVIPSTHLVSTVYAVAEKVGLFYSIYNLLKLMNSRL